MRGNVLGFGCEEQYFSSQGQSQRKVNHVNSSHKRNVGKSHFLVWDSHALLF